MFVKTFVSVCALVALSACSVAAADWTTIVPTATPSVLRLEIQKGDHQGVCSAVLFNVDSDGRAEALTAAHCMEHDPAEHFAVTANDHHAEPLVINDILDLAIIQYRPKSGDKPIVFATATPATGSEVAILGYAFGVQDVVAQFGYVAQVFNKETKSAWLNAELIFGDSGGAVIDTLGHLVGVNSAIFASKEGTAHVGMMVPIEAVQEFVDSYHHDQAKRAKK